DNGNNFLYASGTLFSDTGTAKKVKEKLKASFDKAKVDAYGNESGRITMDDPFNPKQQQNQQNVPVGGFAGGAGVDNEQTKNIIEALNEYVKSARVYNNGRLVIVEGMIPHGMPEQGTFEKFWAAV